jgi:acetyltransferase-like isoleucine patch superfamily enzyme
MSFLNQKILNKAIKAIILDIKTYLVVKVKYLSKYPTCNIESYIYPTTKIGDNVIIKSGVYISSVLNEIGVGTYIGSGTSIFECVKIGNYCSISHGVKIGLSNHALDHISTNPLFYDKSRGFVDNTTFFEKSQNRTIIEHDVLISANALIMSGITIGTGSVIGAGSFVNKDVPPYAIVAGTPAKIIKMRFEKDLVDQLLNSEWWNTPLDKLKKKNNLFNNLNKYLNEN